MRKSILISGILVVLTACAAAVVPENEINQQLDSKAGKEIVLVKVMDDSRCPEGTQCIWAGEVSVEVAAYENKKLIEQRTFTLNFNKDNMDTVKHWFEKNISAEKTAIKEINVVPYPKEGVPIQPEDYKIALKY